MSILFKSNVLGVPLKVSIQVALASLAAQGEVRVMQSRGVLNSSLLKLPGNYPEEKCMASSNKTWNTVLSTNIRVGAFPVIFAIDPLHSVIEFSVGHLNISLVKGRFSEVRGTIDLDPQYPERSSITAQAATESIYTGSAQRDAHLRSADFFDAATYPTIAFESTQIQLVDQTHCWLGGNLSLHGMVRPITFRVTYTGTSRDPLTDAWRIGLSATTKIDRREYGMKFSSRLAEGIAMIGNETRIDIYVEALSVAV